MTIIQQSATLVEFIYKQKAKGLKVGFVPTMGALHNGHIELIKAAENSSDYTVCSIFVNPTQFNDPADYKKYPNRLPQDLQLLTAAGNDLLFMPAVDELYPNGVTNLERYELGNLETMLEGKFRPGHFQGVCQVMSRLLKAVNPDLLFMGQKDFQQCMVIRRLIELMQLDVELITIPTVREADGLAMSSRNLRLTPEQRKKAPAIFRSLQQIKDGSASVAEARKMLADAGFRTDYLEVVDVNTLEMATASQNAVALVAAYLGEVRLIDNLVLPVNKKQL